MSLPELRAPARLLRAALWWCLCMAPALASDSIRLSQPDGSALRLDAPASRMVTLSPHLAELAFTAGAGDRLLATVDYSDYPAVASALPRIGDAFRFDLERILALRPDLVLAWGSGNPTAALARLEGLGLNVWRIEIRRPADIPWVIDEIARSAGLPSPESSDRAREQLRRIESRYAGRSVLRFFYQVSERPLFTLNGQHLVSQGLALCGGENIFFDQAVIAPQVSREAVLQADPDVLIAPVLPDQADPLAHWLGWPAMRAVRHRALVRLPADEISRATPRALDALEHACSELDRLRHEMKKELPG